MRKCLAILLSAGVLFAVYTFSVTGPTQDWHRAFAEDDSDDDDAFDNRSMRGDFVLSMDGSFSSAPPPFTGERENFAFTFLGLLHFDGAGQVAGEATLVFENTSAGLVVPRTVVGTYSVAEDGRMTIETDEFVGGFKSNEVTYDCVIVQRRKLARCAITRLIGFSQGPDPVELPISAIGAFERQK